MSDTGIGTQICLFRCQGNGFPANPTILVNDGSVGSVVNPNVGVFDVGFLQPVDPTRRVVLVDVEGAQQVPCIFGWDATNVLLEIRFVDGTGALVDPGNVSISIYNGERQNG